MFSLIFLASLLGMSVLMQAGHGVAPESLTGRQAALDDERHRVADQDVELAQRRFLLALKYHSRYRQHPEIRNIHAGKTYRDDVNVGICGELLLRKSDGAKAGYVGFIGIDDLQGQPIFIFEDDQGLRMTWETVARNIGCISK
jgi:hypothetical protein